jgi:lipopolysaccharide export system permease protein
MRILDIYIGKILLRHILVTVVVLLGLFVFIVFIEELSKIDKGNYGILKIIQYTVLGIPKILYEVFPMAALIGSILGLSVLARDSELIVMRAAGVSIMRITGSVLKVGVILALVAMVMGEIISPYTETKAQRIRAESMQTNIGSKEETGLWMRDDNTYVNIGEVLPNLNLLRIKIFEFDNKNFLRFLSTAEEGEYQERNQRWVLKGLKRTMIDDTSSAADKVTAAYWSTVVSPEMLRVFMIQPEQLSVWQLTRYIKHLKSNKQDTINFELAYWAKIVTPFATAVMLILSVPFVFKEARSGTMGRSLFSGIMIGLGFWIMNKAFTYFVPLFNIPPFIGAFLPTLLVCLLSIYMIRRIV